MSAEHPRLGRRSKPADLRHLAHGTNAERRYGGSMELRIAFREIEPPSGWTSDESTGTRLSFGGWLELIRSIEGFLVRESGSVENPEGTVLRDDGTRGHPQGRAR